VHREVEELFRWINNATVADHGILGVLQRSADGKDWVRVAGRNRTAGSTLRRDMPAQDVAALETLFREQSGFAGLPMGEPASDRFVAWAAVPNWDWLMYATGDQEAFLANRSEEHTSELQSRENLVCRLLLEKKKGTPPRLGM